MLEKQIAVEADGGIDDIFGYNGPSQMVTRILHKPEFSSEATLAAFDAVIREVQENGISEDELQQLKVKWRSDYYSTLEGGRGGYMPRYGLMHLLACFTLFDNDPLLVNSILDGFLAVKCDAIQSVAQKYLRPENRAIVFRKPAAGKRRPRNGFPRRRGSQPGSAAFRRAPGYLAESHQIAPVQRPEIVLAEAHSIPKFHGQLSFRSGNAAASSRALGLAEMTATVLRTGTTKRASRQIEEDLRRIGADLSTSAGQDNSAIAFAGLSELAEPLLALVNELAREAAFPEAEFERERRQKLEEVKLQRTQPGFLAGERLRKILFGSHPYADISPANSKSLRISAKRCCRLIAISTRRKTRCCSWSAISILPPCSRPLRKSSATGPERSPQPLITPLPPSRAAATFISSTFLARCNRKVLLGCHAITRKNPDWIRLGLTNSLYGGAFNSRLVMNIREDKGYTYSPRSGVNPLRQHGYFSVSAAVRNDVVAASLTEMFYEMDKLRSVPVPEPELADARNYLSGVFSMGLATQDGLLSQLGTRGPERSSR